MHLSTVVVVPPTELHSHWEWVRKGLEHVRTKTAADWLPEDVYAAIRSGSAFLYLISDVGFAVLQRQIQPYGVCLFVWVIYGKLAPLQSQIEQELNDLALSIGARRIRMQSPRRAWERKGYVPKETIYERQVMNQPKEAA